MSIQLNPKTKTKLRDSIRSSGFGFDYRKVNEEKSPVTRKTKEITLKFMDMLDSELEQLTGADREEFLGDMTYNLGGVMACIYDIMGLGHDRSRKIHTQIPEDLFKACRYDNHFLDHFTKNKFPTPYENSRTYEYKYTSHPYSSFDSDYFEELIPALKDAGYRFEISAESNYFPGRTLQIMFEKVVKVTKK